MPFHVGITSSVVPGEGSSSRTLAAGRSTAKPSRSGPVSVARTSRGLMDSTRASVTWRNLRWLAAHECPFRHSVRAAARAGEHRVALVVGGEEELDRQLVEGDVARRAEGRERREQRQLVRRRTPSRNGTSSGGSSQACVAAARRSAATFGYAAHLGVAALRARASPVSTIVRRSWRSR